MFDPDNFDSKKYLFSYYGLSELPDRYHRNVTFVGDDTHMNAVEATEIFKKDKK